MAGERWFYRYPVRNRRTGKIDYIEGPSVKCTNAVARLFGNCSVESRTVRLDDKTYKTGIKVPDKELAACLIKRHKFHGDWNYEIHPRQSSSMR